MTFDTMLSPNLIKQVTITIIDNLWSWLHINHKSHNITVTNIQFVDHNQAQIKYLIGHKLFISYKLTN